eukprot:9469473-Pyramimonas_sp.AAC.1
MQPALRPTDTQTIRKLRDTRCPTPTIQHAPDTTSDAPHKRATSMKNEWLFIESGFRFRWHCRNR